MQISHEEAKWCAHNTIAHFGVVGPIIKVDIVQTRARFLSSPNSNFFVVDPRVYLLPGEMIVLV